MTSETRAADPAAPRRIIVLGSTGSIGTSTLAVVRHLNQAASEPSRRGPRFRVVGLAAGNNRALLDEQRRAWPGAAIAATAAGDSGLDFAGPDSARHLIDAIAEPGDLVVAAMVGAAGLPATLAAIERGCDIALANKETLVAAGSVVMPAVARRGVALLPVDSEHSALAQALRSGRSPEEVARIVITASGGPFRTWSRERMRAARPEDALRHPTWTMGRKITIDSASMMNKALEIIEAHWLFALPAERIEAVVHPQSIVHSLVEFIDGSTIAQLSPPDMRLPIQTALTWPQRIAGASPTMPWDRPTQLDFEPVDHDRFPAISLAWRVVREGGSAGAVLNAVNEVAVDAFLAERLPFLGIAEIVAEALDALPPRNIGSLDEVLAADREARRWAEVRIARGAESPVRVRG